jgi:predicted acylesterase/phospholipase RssA
MAERRKCDIVMQGGITSGVVYPGLVCKLAEHYDFQNIGGTSAGAIAASLTAAAEFARRRGKQDAFTSVAEVSGWLGSDSEFGSGSNLFALFQPQRTTRDLFRFATAFLVKGFWRRIFAFLMLFAFEIVIGIIPALLLHHFSLSLFGLQHWLEVILVVLVAIAGVFITAAVGLIIRLCFLPQHYFGLCTGSASSPEGRAPALVPWLHGKINETSGKPPDEPLTFGDLHAAGITLKMMTTCLTWGRPFTLPFTTNAFYFSPKEFRDFFPPEVVRWLEDHPPKDPEKSNEPVDTTGLLPMPDWDDLPVIVAARLSLSFPFLFCTVPLYAVDFTLRKCEKSDPAPKPDLGSAIPFGEPRVPEHVWFTDGGICNNFPLHLFDAPVPRWPTFGIELTHVRPDRKPTDSRVWMATSNGGGINPEWTRLTAKNGPFGIIELVVAIIDAARNWVNSLQAIAPGYRDRIVHIALNKKEGGLNLNMPQEVVASLNEYGKQAAERLIEHFIYGKDQGKPMHMTWNNQRWIRYRSSMALLETFLADFAYGIKNPEPGDPPYSDLIKENPSYELASYQRVAATLETQAVVAMDEQMSKELLEEGSPHPEPTLVIRPSF